MSATSDDPIGWLAEAQRRGATPAEAQARFDAAPPAPVTSLLGRWRGSGLPTGHPWDGLLEATGWYGKEFRTTEDVHPLLFSAPGGRVVPIEPRYTPVGLLTRWRGRLPAPPRFTHGLLRALLATRRPAARLRAIEHRGVVTAAMIYDRLPIHDVFRAFGDDTLLGWMDLRGLEQPFFFVLTRESA